MPGKLSQLFKRRPLPVSPQAQLNRPGLAQAYPLIPKPDPNHPQPRSFASLPEEERQRILAIARAREEANPTLTDPEHARLRKSVTASVTTLAREVGDTLLSNTPPPANPQLAHSLGQAMEAVLESGLSAGLPQSPKPAASPPGRSLPNPSLSPQVKNAANSPIPPEMLQAIANAARHRDRLSAKEILEIEQELVDSLGPDWPKRRIELAPPGSPPPSKGGRSSQAYQERRSGRPARPRSSQKFYQEVLSDALSPDEAGLLGKLGEPGIGNDNSAFRVCLLRLLRMAFEVNNLEEMIQFINVYGISLLRLARLMETMNAQAGGMERLNQELLQVANEVLEQRQKDGSQSG
jgi:hypothetical protein